MQNFQTTEDWQHHLTSVFDTFFFSGDKISKEDFRTIWKQNIDQELQEEIIDYQFDQADQDQDGFLTHEDIQGIISKQFKEEVEVENVARTDLYNDLQKNLEDFKAKIKEVYQNETVSVTDTEENNTEFKFDLKDVQLKVYTDTNSEKLLFCRDQLEKLICILGYKDQSTLISFSDIDELMKQYKAALKQEYKEMEQKMEAKTLVNILQDCNNLEADKKLIALMMSIIQKGSNQYFNDDDKFQLEIAFASYQNNNHELTKRETLYTILESPTGEDTFHSPGGEHGFKHEDSHDGEESKFDYFKDIEIQKLNQQIHQLNFQLTMKKEKNDQHKQEIKVLKQKLLEAQQQAQPPSLELGQSSSAKNPQYLALGGGRFKSINSMGPIRQGSLVNQMQSFRKNINSNKQTTASQVKVAAIQKRFGNDPRIGIQGLGRLGSYMSAASNTYIIRGGGGDEASQASGSFVIDEIQALSDYAEETEYAVDFKKIKKVIKKQYDPNFEDNSLQIFKSNIYMWITNGDETKRSQSYLIVTSKMIFCFDRQESTLNFAIPLEMVTSLYLSLEDKNVGAFYFHSPQKIDNFDEYYFFYETCKTHEKDKDGKVMDNEGFSENQKLVIYVKSIVLEDKVKGTSRKIPALYKDPIVFTNAQRQEKLIYMYSMYMMNAEDKYARFKGSVCGTMEEAFYTTLGYIFNSNDWKESFFVIFNGYLCKYSHANLDQIVQEYQLNNYRMHIFKNAKEYPKRKFVLRLTHLKSKKMLEYAVANADELVRWSDELAKHVEK